MKFSIVTPVYNGERHIGETIESVLSQEGLFEIEYIVQDGGSSDRTMDIVRSYEERLSRGEYPVKCRRVTMSSRSSKDEGMYDAINKGFGRAAGDIYAWINAGDFYLSKAFEGISRIMAAHPEVKWLKGVTVILENGETTHQRCYLFRQEWIARGVFGRYAPFINQDSVFWRRALWEEAGPIDPAFKLAGDYALWVRMAARAPLYGLAAEISCYRYDASSLGQRNMAQYREEQRRAVPERKHDALPIKAFFWLRSRLGRAAWPWLDTLYALVFPSPAIGYFSFDGGGALVRRHSRRFSVAVEQGHNKRIAF